MSKSRAELVERALINLGVIAEGQSVAAEDTSKMDGYVDSVVAELNDLDIYYVDDPGSLGPTDGEIPDGAFLALADYLANAAAAGFNLPADQKLMTLAEVAKGKLITLARPARTRRRLAIDPALTGRRGHYRGH